MKLVFIFLMALLTACQNNDNQTLLQYPIEIKLNETGASFDQRLANKYLKINKQPAGLNFHKMRFPLKEPATLKFLHGDYSFEIPSVLSFTGTENIDFMDRGLSRFSIRAGISDADLIDHDEARIKLYQMFKGLLDKGWKVRFGYSSPRIIGKDSYTYTDMGEIYKADPRYMPSLDIWMKMSSSFWWEFFSDNAYLRINLDRDTSRMELNKPGAYILSYTINDLETQAKLQMKFKEREMWKALWVEKIKKLKRRRYQKEADLAAQGFNIDTLHPDPIIHPADPVEP